MREKNGVSDSEWEVLKMLWACGSSVRQTELLEKLNESGKKWKRQTVNTFLSRLEEKGLVRREAGIVTAVYDEEEYCYRQLKHEIDTMYKGKLSRLLAAFGERNALTEEDEREILELIRKKGTDFAVYFCDVLVGKCHVSPVSADS